MSDNQNTQLTQTPAQRIGDEALSASWDRLEDGGTITISTDGTHDFGDQGPTLVFRQTFEDVEDGGSVPSDAGGGVGTVEKADGVVENAPDLPYGKGQVIGDGIGVTYRVLYDQADEFYEHYYLQWPDAHQDAADVANIDEGAGWQIKSIWHFLGEDGHGGPDANDVYAGFPTLYAAADPSYWTYGSLIQSNSKPTSDFSDHHVGIVDPNNRSRWRSEPISKQLWVKCGPENGEATGSDGMLRNASVEDGEVAYSDYHNSGYWTEADADETGFDRFTIPGFTRGYDYNEGWHLYYSDIYQTAGPGAAARVEVTDSDTYRESKRITVFTVQSWSSTEVTAEIVEGIFHDESLEGKHLWLTDADNESLYVGQLEESEPEETLELDRPELGFVDGNFDEPEVTRLDRPFLNARQQYTHIVEDGLTRVTSGSIKCALDGGTFQIAMYDVTDGVVGAPRVFKEEITLPEEPKDGDDGYVVDTHTFDVDPVELTDYVGHELAVAVRHDRVRPRSINWPKDHPDEYGWGYAEGKREGPLAETWQHDLQDGGSGISAALFVEPVEVPAGKARTVVGSEIFGTRSQTVFAAFPDISPESGMVVEYDAQTAAGAPVTVLANGGIEIGRGSAATDSFDASIRDTEGTWHGPETITLVERDG